MQSTVAYLGCTIDDSIKGAASLSRYGITFDDIIDVKYSPICGQLMSQTHLKGENKIILIIILTENLLQTKMIIKLRKY